jgi:hypothetical protein
MTTRIDSGMSFALDHGSLMECLQNRLIGNFALRVW